MVIRYCKKLCSKRIHQLL